MKRLVTLCLTGLLLCGCSGLDQREMARLLKFEQECEQSWAARAGMTSTDQCVQEKAMLWQARADAVMRMPGMDPVNF